MSQVTDAIRAAFPALLNVFGEAVTYRPSDGPSRTVRMIDLDPRAVPDADPQFALRWALRADIGAPQRGDEIEDGGVAYLVTSVRHDNSGGVYLQLDKQ